MEYRARRVFFLGCLLVLLVIPALGGGSAFAATCYSQSSKMHDICPTGNDSAYDNAASLRGSIAVIGGSRRLVYGHPNSLDVWDLSSPQSFSRLTSNSLGIRSGSFTGRDDDTHWYQTDHLRDIATLDGFGYAFCSLYNYGWQVLQISPSVAWAGGYEPASPNGAPPYLFARLFQASDGQIYVVSRNLNGSSEAALYIYLLNGTGKPASGFSSATLDDRLVARVPIGTSLDGPLAGFPLTTATIFEVYTRGTSQYLLVDSTSGIGVVNITAPDTPTAVVLWSKSSPAQLGKGPWVVDDARDRLYVADTSSDTVYTIDLTSLTTPSLLYSSPWPGGGKRTATFLSLAGDLLVVGYYRVVGYLNVGGASGPDAIDEQADGITDLTRSCAVALGDTVSDLEAFQANGLFYVARFLMGSGDVVGIGSSCMSTTPKPDMAVALNSTEPGTYACTATADVKGYPGDSFTITNNTTGSWTDPEFVVKKGVVEVVRQAMSTTTATWTPSTGIETGSYTIDIEVTGQDLQTYSTATAGKTKTVYLCGTPHAAAAVIKVAGSSCTSCTWLTNQSVTAGAGNPTTTGRNLSQGHPSSYDWRLVPPTGAAGPADFSSAEPSATLDLRGSYKLLLVAHYAHDAAVDDTPCTSIDDSDALTFFGAKRLEGSYDSCAMLTLDSQPFNVGELLAYQGTSSTPPFLISQAISLQAPCAVASGWAPTFTPSVDGGTVSSTNTCSGGKWTGSIAAGTYTVAGNHTATLTASATDGSDTVNVQKTEDFSVIDTVGVMKVEPGSPTAGQLATFWLDNVTVAITKVVWDFGSAGCGSESQTYTCNASALFTCIGDSQTVSHTYKNSAQTTYTVKATLTLSGGGTALVTKDVIVKGGSCPSSSTTTTQGGGSTTTTSGCSESSTPVVDFSWTPTAPTAGQAVSFSASGSANPTQWEWDFGDGEASVQKNPVHTFDTAGTYSVSVQAKNCKDWGALKTKQVQVNSACAETAAPTADFTASVAEPRATLDEVKYTDTSTGTESSREWTAKNSSNQTVCSDTERTFFCTFPQKGTYTVSLKAINCFGSNTKMITVNVKSPCDQTQSPVADFSWAPTGAADGFPSQQQPYEGQQVQFTDKSTNSPDGWHWYDFQESQADYSVQNPKHTWKLPGAKTVRLIATNCYGAGSETSKNVTVYEDNRAVTADFSWSVQTLEEADVTVPTGVPVKFTASTGYAKGDPTEFSFRFGDDDTTPTATLDQPYVNHTFLCRGKVQVALIARRKMESGRVVSGTVTKTVDVDGTVCGPEALVAPDAAQVPGLNGTSWRTDLRIFNPSVEETQVWLAVLPAGQNNAQPFQVGPYVVPPKGTQALNNILQMFELLLQKNYTKAAVRITFENSDDEHPIVVGRTYTDVSTGGTYGQYVPGVPVIPNSTTSPLWITGMRHDGTETGFRTNLGFANLRGDAGGITGLQVSLLDATGALRASKTFNLAPYGYLQDTLKNLFGAAADTLGVFSLKIEVPENSDVQPYASVVDNLTGDNVLISAVPPIQDTVYLPAVAHNPGEAGTVWRTSVQVTNTDDTAHSIEIKFFPKSASVPGTFRTISLAPGQSARTEDIIDWIYSPLQAPDASGVIRISSADGSGVMPAVAARTYNLTANGTFGQDVPPLQAAMGVKKGGESETMYIAGMSSADVARSNLGFVSLSDTQGVDFAVYFYDGDGNMLNPEGKPYTFAIGPNGWDQDKLENRFKNFFKQDLPANLEVISAEIVVRAGGPGFAYASVIDNITGDPIFVPGHTLP